MPSSLNFWKYRLNFFLTRCARQKNISAYISRKILLYICILERSLLESLNSISGNLYLAQNGIDLLRFSEEKKHQCHNWLQVICGRLTFNWFWCTIYSCLKTPIELQPSTAFVLSLLQFWKRHLGKYVSMYIWFKVTICQLKS